ncbi:ubiquitin-conjugating enzyme E2 Z isoform X2 [Molothrus ater]|uniref:ubiquitin-conjugating enzyme E2 Z isoform X2 n=1 Tax=Molothrus ater TaxID=84834 RepID=UPI0023E7663A|nr:ubiquitin-conjugating enzyme E2 Z isoform X2 [Molothrus ater]
MRRRRRQRSDQFVCFCTIEFEPFRRGFLLLEPSLPHLEFSASPPWLGVTSDVPSCPLPPCATARGRSRLGSGTNSSAQPGEIGHCWERARRRGRHGEVAVAAPPPSPAAGDNSHRAWGEQELRVSLRIVGTQNCPKLPKILPEILPEMLPFTPVQPSLDPAGAGRTPQPGSSSRGAGGAQIPQIPWERGRRSPNPTNPPWDYLGLQQQQEGGKWGIFQVGNGNFPGGKFSWLEMGNFPGGKWEFSWWKRGISLLGNGNFLGGKWGIFQVGNGTFPCFSQTPRESFPLSLPKAPGLVWVQPSGSLSSIPRAGNSGSLPGPRDLGANGIVGPGMELENKKKKCTRGPGRSLLVSVVQKNFQ